MAGKSGLIAQSSSFGEGDFPSVGVGVFYPSIADDGVVDVCGARFVVLLGDLARMNRG